jgi:type IV pilus assembly protein PilW
MRHRFGGLAALRSVRGFGLVECLVAVALGTVVAIAALTVYARAAADGRTSGALQQLHENARYAADLLESELRAAGHAGLAPDLAFVEGATPLGTPPPPTLAVAGCATALALDVARHVTGADGRYAADAATPLTCAPSPNGRAVAGADTLTIRRARFEPGSAERGRLQLASTRARGVLMTDGLVPAALSAGEVHDLVVGTYYVSADSTGLRGLPSLRRKRLVGGAGGPRFEDEELASGIEDLQVEFGVDGPDADEVPERYVAADDIAADDIVRTVRFWLLARADSPDPTWRDTVPRRYADRELPGRGDAYRRVVVERTVYVRNLRRR